ncbi:hypothetical protein, partial [Streptomyces niveiscabiei]
PPHWPGGLTVALHPLPVTHTDTGILLQLREEYDTRDGTPAGITGELIHDHALCDRKTAERLIAAFKDRLTALCADPDAPIVLNGPEGESHGNSGAISRPR